MNSLIRAVLDGPPGLIVGSVTAPETPAPLYRPAGAGKERFRAQTATGPPGTGV